MSQEVELYCTLDEDTGEWLVWFPHPLGGKKVLESFDDELSAKQFYQDQIDNIENT